MAEKTSTKWKGNQLYGKMYLQMIPQPRVWSPEYIEDSHKSTPGRQLNEKMGKVPEQILLQGGHTEDPIWAS